MAEEVTYEELVESESISTAQNEKENNKSFFLYLKKNPSVAIAIITGFVAVFSFVINMSIYLYEKMYLLYWDVDSTYVISGSPNMVYTVLSSLILSVAVFISFFVVDQIYCKNADDISFYYYCKLLVNRIKKDSRKLRKKCYKLLFKSVILKKLKEERSDIKKIIDNCSNRIKSGRVLLKPNAKRCNKRAMLCFISVFIILFIISFVMYMTLPDYIDFNQKLLLSLITSLMTAVKVISESEKSNVKKKQIRDLANKDYDSDVKLNEDALKECYKNYKPFEPTANDTFISFSITVCGILITILILFSSFGHITASSKNTFEITQVDSIPYVVIYKNNDLVILEQAKVNDDRLVVFTSEQTIEKYSKVSYELRDFDTVKRTKELFYENESTTDEVPFY